MYRIDPQGGQFTFIKTGSTTFFSPEKACLDTLSTSHNKRSHEREQESSLYLLNFMRSKNYLQKLLSGLPFPEVFFWLGLVIMLTVIAGLAAGIELYVIYKGSFDLTIKEMIQIKLASDIEIPALEASNLITQTGLILR